jgi:GntR family transcriptional regulator, transcriptional repressor for pyruvate dehydrogenase complex
MNDDSPKVSIKESVKVAEQIRTQIYRGILNTGDRLLPEKDLVSHFGVSRPTLREALRLLEAESLILIQRGSGGVRVMQPNPASLIRQFGGFLQRQNANLEDIFNARGFIEPNAAYLLATNASRTTITAMEENIKKTQDVIAVAGDISDLIFEFSEMVVNDCGNRTIKLICLMLQQLIKTQISISASNGVLAPDDIRARWRTEVENRIDMVQAVKDRDSERAARVWRTHILGSKEALLSAYSMHGQLNILWAAEQPAEAD